jgi:ABC-type sugar transport system ATPase subunit
VVDGEVGADGLRTPWGLLRTGRQLEHDGAVRVVLRPDAVRLDPAGAARGRVVRRAWAGDRTELTVESGGVLLRVRVAEPCSPEAGDSVSLAIEPGAVLVYPVPLDEPLDRGEPLDRNDKAD